MAAQFIQMIFKLWLWTSEIFKCPESQYFLKAKNVLSNIWMSDFGAAEISGPTNHILPFGTVSIQKTP